MVLVVMGVTVVVVAVVRVVTVVVLGSLVVAVVVVAVDRGTVVVSTAPLLTIFALHAFVFRDFPLALLHDGLVLLDNSSESYRLYRLG